jgi:hypothetical protein
MNEDLEKRILQNRLKAMEIEQMKIDEVIEQYKNIYDKLNKDFSGDLDSISKIAAMIQQNYILKTQLEDLDDDMIGVNCNLEDIKKNM